MARPLWPGHVHSGVGVFMSDQVSFKLKSTRNGGPSSYRSKIDGKMTVFAQNILYGCSQSTFDRLNISGYFEKIKHVDGMDPLLVERSTKSTKAMLEEESV